MSKGTPLWFYLRNVFDNVTSNNLKRMLSLSSDHRDKLYHVGMTDPDINELYLLMQPAYSDFIDKYSKQSAAFRTYNNATLTVEGLFSDLSSKHIKRWDIKIQSVLEDDTVTYMKLLPKGRAPYQKGAYEMRILAVQVLAKSLLDYPTLSHVLVLVESFLTEVQTARTYQQGKESNEKHERIALEAARANLALVMHRIFGKLIYLYAETPKRVEAFYELHYFQASKPSASAAQNLPVAANSRHIVMKGLYKDQDEFAIANTGKTTLGFFVTESELVATPDDLTILRPGKSETFTLSELSDGTTPRMLIVVNITSQNGLFKAGLISSEKEDKSKG